MEAAGGVAARFVYVWVWRGRGPDRVSAEPLRRRWQSRGLGCAVEDPEPERQKGEG